MNPREAGRVKLCPMIAAEISEGLCRIERTSDASTDLYDAL